MRTTCSKSLTRVLQSSQLILSQSCQDQELRRIHNIRIIMNYQTVRLVSTSGQAAAFPVFGHTQKWKLRPFPVLGLPKNGNCGRVSSFGPLPLLGLHTRNQSIFDILQKPFSLSDKQPNTLLGQVPNQVTINT